MQNIGRWKQKINGIELCENKSGGNGNGEIIKWTIERGRNLAPGSITHKWPNNHQHAVTVLLLLLF